MTQADAAAGSAALEVERKYEVPADVPLPAPERFRALGYAPDAPISHHLSATYFDTADGALAACGLALRTRSGGKDAGWHLKERRPEGVLELTWPPEEAMPRGLRDEIEARIGDAAEGVEPIARLDTERTVLLLRDAAGRQLVEIADDRVRAHDVDADVRRAWREWEAELMPGVDAAELDRVEPVLLAAGAAPSLSVAKIARATGRLIAMARARGAGDAVLAALGRLEVSDREAARRLDA